MNERIRVTRNRLHLSPPDTIPYAGLDPQGGYAGLDPQGGQDTKRISFEPRMVTNVAFVHHIRTMCHVCLEILRTEQKSDFPVTKVSFETTKKTLLCRGTFSLEVGSRFVPVFTSGIAHPEFKPYRIISAQTGHFKSPADSSPQETNKFSLRL